jgi:hypothetical protein
MEFSGKDQMADDIEIIATASDAEANSYLTDDEAEALLEGFPSSDAWEALEDDARAAILLEGTRRIDQFKTWSPRRVSDQALAFPRKIDKAGVIPAGVKRALAAFANYMAGQDLTALKTLQSEGVTSASILGQNLNFEKDKSGLPAEARAELEKLSAATSGWGAHHRDGDCSLFG